MLLEQGNYLFEMIRSEIEYAVGESNLSVSMSDKIAYSSDYYWIPEMWLDRGRQNPLADFIVHPQSTKHVSDIIKIANDHKIPVVPWGGGSGSQGGALPIHGGILMDMKKMNHVIEIDKVALTATAETGINMQQFEWEIEKAGYSTMHFPASITCATFGGFLGHAGTGVLSTKYGKIEDMTISMEVVLPDGTIMNTLPIPRHASGPDFNQLFIGSEGTLGIITKATIKIHPIPEHRVFHAYLYKDMHSAMNAGRKVMTQRLNPCVIRLYDESETKKHIKRVLGIDKKGAYLVIGFDGYKSVVEQTEKIAHDICMSEDAEDLGYEMGERWWEQRYDFFFPPHMFALPQAYGTLDTVATFSNIENVYWGMKYVVEENFPEATFIGHFSHWYDWGCMLYARFIVDKAPDDPAVATRYYNKIWDMALDAALANGGVLNEHHGIGLKLGRKVRSLYGNMFPLLKGIKQTLDKENIMNPGKMGL